METEKKSFMNFDLFQHNFSYNLTTDSNREP